MFKMFNYGLLTALLAVTVSCATAKKPTEVESDSSVVSKDINFDAQGSDSGNIQGLTTVHFEYDQSALTEEAKKLLSANAEWIRKNTGMTVQVEGHCDARGSVEYNLALGERRAKSVKNYLVSLGIPSNSLTIISYGKERMLDQGDSEEAHAKNRRANFVPLPK